MDPSLGVAELLGPALVSQDGVEAVFAASSRILAANGAAGRNVLVAERDADAGRSQCILAVRSVRSRIGAIRGGSLRFARIAFAFAFAIRGGS